MMKGGPGAALADSGTERTAPMPSELGILFAVK